MAAFAKPLLCAGRIINTELSNLEAQKEEEITKLMESKRGLANQRVSNEKLADNLSKLFE